ncbi:hypothetical protein [Kribbella sp. CA-293567]|uniref:hypothetical protein n=1 Tax=Kribbella sp. CA-293567 TaxID=3002436 RepID=UPI0022DD7F17|nr:hypothetical protein [Kribbella sp. CA-293567]WBQ07721.1 hypothetical protein OX958_13180 [Kribbella sp. CA-293567]
MLTSRAVAAGAIAVAALAGTGAVPAAAAELTVQTDVFLCDYDTAQSNGYLYVRNDGTRFTCFANAGSAGVWIGNAAYWCSFDNAGAITYNRPDIVGGKVFFGRGQCGSLAPNTTVTNVTIY